MEQDQKQETASIGGEIVSEIFTVGKAVATLVVPGAGAFISVLTMVGGLFNSLYAKAKMYHGAAIPDKPALWAKIDANQAEIDGGKII